MKGRSMGFIYEERLSDSPYIETITTGRTEGTGSTIRPAECNWHMVFVKLYGQVQAIVVGPLMTSGVVSYGEGAEILWIKFKLGTFMPHLPAKNYLDTETILPEASSKTFWLNSSSWQLPDFENVDTFIDRLVRDDVLASDPVVHAALQDQPLDVAQRTIRHRFLRATGLTQTYIKQGLPILDTAFEAGYFDQPHLTRALKQFIGYTPAQIVQMSKHCHSIQDTAPELDYDGSVPVEVR
jgi:hypothetical protein